MADQPQHIIYLIPRGRLNEALLEYSKESRPIIENEAHKYLPHCTLTGFFTLDQTKITIKQLTELLHKHTRDIEESLSKKVKITGIFKTHHIGLALEAPELHNRIENFALELKEKFQMEIRVKPGPGSGYHISLAYGVHFEADIKEKLLELVDAKKILSFSNDVQWTIGVYRRDTKDQDPAIWMKSSVEELAK